MKVIVCGAGQQGTPIAYALLKMGLNIIIVDPFQANIEKAQTKFKKILSQEIEENRFMFSNSLESINESNIDFLISAAPYHQNVRIAEWATSRQIPYFDLGGDPDTHAKIYEKSDTYHSYVMTDLGLAPGLVNIIAEYMTYKALKQNKEVIDVYMRVGGLPTKPKGFMKYQRTWSTHGLRNEYSGDCYCIKHKNKTSAPALTEVENMNLFPDLGELECFHTKGGLSHSYKDLWTLGISNCNYKTIRWRDHAKILRFLIEECKLSSETFDRAIENACPETQEDQVLIAAQVNEKVFKTIIMHDDNWTAMQISTAFPAVAAALTVINNISDKQFIQSYSKKLTYQYISKYKYDYFVDILCKIDNQFSDLKIY